MNESDLFVKSIIKLNPGDVLKYNEEYTYSISKKIWTDQIHYQMKNIRDNRWTAKSKILKWIPIEYGQNYK